MLSLINHNVLKHLLECIIELSKLKDNESIIKTFVLNSLKLYHYDYQYKEESIQNLIKELINRIEYYSTNEIIYQYFEKEHFFNEQNITDEQWINICEQVSKEICNGNDVLRNLVEEVINELNN